VSQKLPKSHRPIFNKIGGDRDGFTHYCDTTGPGCCRKGMPMSKFWVLIANDGHHG
jgi:hypothetical protein